MKASDMEDILVLHPGDAAPAPRKIVLGAGESLSLTVVALPGVSADVNLDVDLEGEGASFNMGAAFVSGGDDRFSLSVRLCHRVPRCDSRQTVRGIADGNARGAFHGLIKVAQDAQKTQAYQECHSLLLGDNAKITTEPQLEIYADDVKCSHGAAVGRLNEEEQFYMRSRGISGKEAKVLQMISFVRPSLDFIEDLSARERIAGEIENEIRRMVL